MENNGGDEAKREIRAPNYAHRPWLSPVVVIAVSILASIFVLILFAIVDWDKGGVLTRMSEIEFARGLITYLFAVVTIGTAVVLIVHVLTSVATPDDEKRFQHGKEVLSLLLGIFGTIVGFYFGREVVKPGEGTLSVAPLKLSALSVPSGGKLTVTTVALGGRAPLHYAILFGADDTIPTVPVDSGGWITRDMSVPPQKAVTQLRVRVLVQDADHHSSDQTAIVEVSPPPATQQ